MMGFYVPKVERYYECLDVVEDGWFILILIFRIRVELFDPDLTFF